MSIVDKTYGNLCQSIIDFGYWYEDKSRGVRCKQISDAKLNISLGEFPLLTTKKMFTKGIVAELIWFLRGDDNIKYLIDNNVHIWDKDAYNWYLSNLETTENVKDLLQFTNCIKSGVGRNKECEFDYTFGDVGRNYGVQWRKWSNFNWINGDTHCTENFDQIKNLVLNLVENPMGRRHIVTAWNPAEVKRTALPPCHWSFEILPKPLYDSDKYGFTLKWHQRSVDAFLGLPFNIASYGILSYIIGEMSGMLPLNLIADLSNVHFYEPHIEVVKEQLKRDPTKYYGCKLKFSDKIVRMFRKVSKRTDFNLLFQSIDIQDIIFENYNSYGKLDAEMFEPKLKI